MPEQKLKCEKHFFIKGDTGMMYKRGVDTENISQIFRKCRKLWVGAEEILRFEAFDRTPFKFQ